MNPMFKYQKDLPMLPVPSLEETCARYYQSVIPLLKTDQDKQRTKTAIETFLKSPQSKTLQDRLLKRREDMAKLGKSWLIGNNYLNG